jgi:hypothetical protein
MYNQEQVILEIYEDVLAAPSHSSYPRAGDRVDEHFGLGVPHYAGKAQLAVHDGAAGKVRPQVRDDGLDLR